MTTANKNTNKHGAVEFTNNDRIAIFSPWDLSVSFGFLHDGKFQAAYGKTEKTYKTRAGAERAASIWVRG
tara:strand:- start:44 stop:253 length:210 start_codon:yes stop_codon:yes gene_type:complete